MLEFHPLQQMPARPQRVAELLQEFKQILLADGMASMDEYGDMLKWALATRAGRCRYFHVFDPGYCSFDDKFYGTVHFHGGQIGGTVLLGEMEHLTYKPELTRDGDRVFDGNHYRLAKQSQVQPAGTSYSLPAMVPHWTRPMELSLTYFEEEDNQLMGDLVNVVGAEPDEHPWEQADADALLPRLLEMIDARLAELTVFA